MEVKVHQIAELIKAEIEGNGEAIITHPDKIEDAGPGAITFYSNPKYEKFLYETLATAVIVEENFIPTRPVSATLLRVSNVYLALSELFQYYEKNESRPIGISEKASLGKNISLGEDIYIGDFSVIEQGTTIGEGSHISSQVYIGENVHIGEKVMIYPGVRIYKNCRIGDRVVLHANAVIGSDGFGFAHDEEGNYIKIPQIGNVVLGDDVEIGANTVIDRASMGVTLIESGVKLDNLIQVGHNVVIGKNTVIAAQTGIAGSTKIGENSRIAGQVGIAGHLSIGAGSEIGAQSGIGSNLKEGGRYFGTPALGVGAFHRSHVVFKELPELRKMIFKMNKKLDEHFPPSE